MPLSHQLASQRLPGQRCCRSNNIKKSLARRPHRFIRPSRNNGTLVEATAARPSIAKFADSIGLPTEEGLFGFKPFSEMWCGRLAMMGFISSIVIEFQTGKGTLQQLGVDTPSTGLLMLLLAAVAGSTIMGAGLTIYNGLNGSMSQQDAARYKQFLLLENEDDLIAASRKQGTAADRFLSPNNMQEIQDARAAGMPADQFLSNDDGLAAAEVARAAGTPADAVLDLSEAAPSVSRPSQPSTTSYDDMWFYNDELKYARDVEMKNGRSAMLGFLAAVLVEAATGKGILMQLIMWGKLSGLLGYESGF